MHACLPAGRPAAPSAALLLLCDEGLSHQALNQDCLYSAMLQVLVRVPLRSQPGTAFGSRGRANCWLFCSNPVLRQSAVQHFSCFVIVHLL